VQTLAGDDLWHHKPPEEGYQAGRLMPRAPKVNTGHSSHISLSSTHMFHSCTICPFHRNEAKGHRCGILRQ
jgi:hypothetical protein